MSSADEPEVSPHTSGGEASDDDGGTGAASAGRPAGGSSGSGHGGPALVFDDPLDRPSSDDTDRGWGGTFSDSGDDDFSRFLNEKPPHHL